MLFFFLHFFLSLGFNYSKEHFAIHFSPKKVVIIISFSRSFVRDWEPDLGGAVKTLNNQLNQSVLDGVEFFL